ncbi:uncharacterized protein LOC132200998 [Neocloeon triangulifer]|uniref:uncharacterized protein LOC132200998 n=1 Tax=Neocloeon triangulifer TaxID=2078957 RepID=UPI00286F26C8|nr:uncharacterized protein LOC132200998 [Neocloeon triangulifer]
MQRCALFHPLANFVCLMLLVGLFMGLVNLKKDLRRQGTILVEISKRLERAEAVMVQRQRVEAAFKMPKNDRDIMEGGIEGRVSRLEARSQKAHELLLGFVYSRAPPAVRHFYIYPSDLVEELTTLDQDSPQLAMHIRKNLFAYPPVHILQNMLPPKDMSRGNGQVLRHIFKDMKHGFFVECGALDGLSLSNTFYLERLLGWTGVLIEPEPQNFYEVLRKKRNVLSIPTCLSRSKRPQLVPFTFGWYAYAKIDTQSPISENTNNVLCVPFYSILRAINRTNIDLFSLDIEGHELDVLRTIPWDKVDIKVLIVEFANIEEGKDALAAFMKRQGYAIFPSSRQEESVGGWAQEDYIFVKKDAGLNEE